MSTLTVTLPEGASVVDGKQLTFRAPCDCTDITGIVINGTTYELVDTSNECISNKGNQFTDGAMVSVILDTENSRAYIQNAYAMPTSGGNFTGKITTPYLSIVAPSGTGRISLTTPSRDSGDIGYNGACFFENYCTDTSYSEKFSTPSPSTGLTANAKYDILTSKTPVTIAQGGTEATTAAEALENLGAVGKTGTQTMTGDLVISKSAPALKLVSTTGGRTAHFWVSSDDNVYMRNSLDDNNRSSLYLQPETITDFGRVLRLQKMVDGTQTYYNIFGQHNKPSGSYTGNGSATQRVINLGITINDTDMVAIHSTQGFVLLSHASGALFNDTNLSVIPYSAAHVSSELNGLVLKSTTASVNQNGTTYYWRVL